MVNKTRDRIHRHRPSSLTLDVEVGKHLVRHRTCNSKYTVNIGLILTNPNIGQLRELGILVSKMPDIQRGRSLRTHLTSHAGGLVTVICPGFLITKDLIILGGALGVNLLIQDRLLTNICKDREIVIKAITTRPKTLKALLIGMVIAGDHNADHETMLNERLDKVTMKVSSNRKSGSIAERSTIRLSSRGLHNLVDINRNTVATKILRTLETSIGRSNAKMRLEDFSVPSTSSCILFIEFLDLKSHAKLIDSGSGNRTVINSPKIVDNGITCRPRSASISRILLTILEKTKSRKTRSTMDKRCIINLVFNQTFRNRIRQRNNGIISTRRNRDSHIGAFLRSRQRGGEVVVELGRLKGHAAFDNISDIVSAVGTCEGSIIHRDIERVREILITEPLVHNKSVGPEGQRINRKIFNTGRNAHIVGNRANRPTAGRSSHLRDGILGRRNPSRLCILTHQLTPMLPNDTVGHKVKIGVQVKIIHHGSKQSLQTGNHGCLHLESIARENLIHIEGDNVSNVKAEFNTMVTPKSATSNIKVSRIKSKSCIFITGQINTSSL
nr:MAG TPA: hypothetical protein [Microviridae sp.]